MTCFAHCNFFMLMNVQIDSTQKVCRKLQGQAANNAAWATNVGNERGEVLISVMTSSESIEALRKMADGLTTRYAQAGLFYTKGFF